jgi:hypothetical protein
MSGSADTEPDDASIPPDREALLDELARCFVQAAVTRLLEELRKASDGLRDKCPSGGHAEKQANPNQDLPAVTVRRPRPRQRKTAARSRRGAGHGLDDNK